MPHAPGATAIWTTYTRGDPVNRSDANGLDDRSVEIPGLPPAAPGSDGPSHNLRLPPQQLQLEMIQPSFWLFGVAAQEDPQLYLAHQVGGRSSIEPTATPPGTYIPAQCRQMASDTVSRSMTRLLRPECADLFGESTTPSSALTEAWNTNNVRSMVFGEDVAPDTGAATFNGAIYLHSCPKQLEPRARKIEEPSYN